MKIKYAVVSEQGLREDMEDSFCVHADFGGRAGEVFAGIFDGHGGGYAANRSARELPGLFSKAVSRARKISVKSAWKRSYESMSALLSDQESGTCATTIYLRPPFLHFANVGDCELVLREKSGLCRTLSISHRVGNPVEAARVRRFGAKISDGYVWNGSDGLQMLRTIGDESFKSIGVIATPECGSIRVTFPFLFLLGTDGLFDTLSWAYIEGVLRRSFEPDTIAAQLKKLADEEHMFDNCTFIVFSAFQ